MRACACVCVFRVHGYLKCALTTSASVLALSATAKDNMASLKKEVRDQSFDGQLVEDERYHMC